MKRYKILNYNDRNVFGVFFLVILQRIGQFLFQCMLSVMRYFRKTVKDVVGIFRKFGVRIRIQKLKNEVEVNLGQWVELMMEELYFKYKVIRYQIKC